MTSSHSPEFPGQDLPFRSTSSAGSSPPSGLNRLRSRTMDISTEERMPSVLGYRSSLPPPPSSSSFTKSSMHSEPPVTPTSSLEFLKRSVENAAASAKSSATPMTSSLNGNTLLTSEALPSTLPPLQARRGRADTMPSLPSALPIHPRSSHHHSNSSLSLSSIAPPSSLLASSTPNGTRHRSGSLTLPSASLSSAFGPSIFSTSWMDRHNETNIPQTQPPATPTTEQLLDSHSAIAHTLASLGLDEPSPSTSSPEPMRLPVEISARPLMNANRFRSYSVNATDRYPDSPPDSGATTPHEGLNNAAMHYAVSSTADRFHAVHTRPRAISLGMLDYSGPGDSYLPPSLRHTLSSSNLQSSLREEYHEDFEDPEPQQPQQLQHPQHRGHGMRPSLNEREILKALAMLESQGMNNSSGSVNRGRSQSFTDAGRPNLGLVLGLDHSLGMSNGAYGGPEYPEDYIRADEFRTPSPGNGLDYPGAHSSSQAMSNSTNSTSQTPTRSLWIGNIDPTFSVTDLTQLFSPYGSIESLRLLPDKECAFINFTRVEDSIRAKDEIMGRMGGRVGNCVVRVGFGKAEAGVNAGNGEAVMQPTRALWIGNIPTTTTPTALHNLFSQFGAIESARVLTHKNCGFVNFERLEDATRAKKTMHGKEALGVGTGAVRIGFAKVPPKQETSPNTTPDQLERRRFVTPTTAPPVGPVPIENYNNSNLMMVMAGMGYSGLTDRQLVMQEFGPEPGDTAFLEDNRLPINYFASIPPVPEPGGRRLDASRLREIRKRLDGGHLGAKEIEVIAAECFDECVELCSDYIGNTVIQKLFERCSENTKTKYLERVAPYLASIGVHKNGTWAAQKIIDCAKTPTQIHLIGVHLAPYTPALLLDQFGNYVVQCCLRLGSTRNQWIFDSMVDRCWEVAQGRFGARAMRATLESQYVSKGQQKYVATAIVQNALLLATNPNGALLLTWLLDTSALSGRYRILAPRVAPHLAHLCTHKLASLTILKIINQRSESDGRDIILNALFFSHNDQVLEEVLIDQVHGVGVVQKVLASPYVETFDKQKIAEKVKDVLNKLKVSQVQGYKRLLEELTVVLGDSSIGSMQGQSPYSNYTYFASGQQSESSPSADSDSVTSSQQSSQPYYSGVTSTSAQMNSFPQSFSSNANNAGSFPNLMYPSQMYVPNYPFAPVMNGTSSPNSQFAALLGGAAPGAQPTGQQQEGSV